nr:hypothetical protein [Tanacetum cinerariifolium]
CDSAPRVTSPAAEEGSMQQTLNELTAFCTSHQRQHLELLTKFQAQEVEINRFKERVKILKDKEGVIGDKSGDDAPIKGRSTNEGEAPAERISNDSEEIARVLTSMDAATVLAGETNVPTGSGFIPTVGPPATIVFTGSEEEIGRLKARVRVLEDREAVASKPSREDALIKRRSNNEGEAAAERISNDSEEIARVLTSMDAATVLAGETNVPTGSGFIPTAGPPTTVISTSSEEVEIIRLKERVKVLEDKDGDKSGDDAPIKGRSNNEGEAPAERISNDLEDIARVLTSMDAATVLAGEANVPTGSGFIPTTGPPATIVSTGSEVGPTASPIVQRRKGKEIMEESDTPKKKKLQEQIDAQVARELEEQQERGDMRMNEQIARDAEVARIHADEEIQGMIDSLDKSNETVATYLQEYQQFASDLSLEKKIELISDLVKYQEHYTKVYKFQSQQRKPMSKKQKREYYMAVIKSNLGWRFKDFK